MNPSDNSTMVNQIYATLREIDSYKYGLSSKVVMMVQTTMLVFLKEKCVSDNFCFTGTGKGYVSYLLRHAWEQVINFCKESDQNSSLYIETYKKLERLNPNDSECKAVFEAIIENQGRLYQESITPSDELAELAVELLDYRGGVVYNPKAGEGSFGIQLNIGEAYFGTTDSEMAWSVGIAKMIFLNKVPSTNYTFAPKSLPEVCTYDRYINIFSSREFEFDEVFPRLNRDGKAVIMMPPGELVNRRNGSIKELIIQNVLDQVIVLPPSLLKNTSVGTAVLVCRLGRKEDEPVTMLSATDEDYYYRDSRKRLNVLNVTKVLSDLRGPSRGNKVEVSREQIAEEWYNLNPGIYLRQEEVLPEGYESAALKDLAQPIRGITRRPLTDDAVMIRPSSLELNQTEFQIDVNLLPKNNDNTSGYGILLTKSYVLVAPKNRRLGAAYYKHREGDQVYIESLSAFKVLEVDESRIDPEYLVFKLRSAEVNFGSSTIASLSLNLQISYPSLAEQRRIIEDTVKANKLAKIREFGLTEELLRLKNEYKTLIRTKKHNLGTVRGNISATIRQLQKQVEQSDQTGEIDIKALLGRVSRLVNYWKDLDGRLDRIADENKFKEAEEFSFDAFFRNLESNKISGNYTLSYSLDKETFDSADAKFAISVNSDDFRQVVENIISNAEKHGFRDPQREDYYINISVYLEESETGEQRVCFMFENNGYPAPEMTNAQFGMSGWHADVKGSKGEGLGGAYISEMTRHFGGGYEAPQSVIDEIGEYSRTRVLIYFPAIIDYNETIHVMKQYAYDTIYDILYTHLKYEEYDINTCFDITFDPELEVYTCPLQDYGYDLNDDGSIYLDENGRPCHSDLPDDIHWINDITKSDENGKRVVNEDYIRKIVDRMFSRDKERISIVS